MDGGTDTERAASELITFYASLLHEAVGDALCRPRLSQAAEFWFDNSGKALCVQLARSVTQSNGTSRASTICTCPFRVLA
jgi:hypothetical protein